MDTDIIYNKSCTFFMLELYKTASSKNQSRYRICSHRTILIGYHYDWTGFNTYIDPKTEFHRPMKTLWDWLQLLIIPLLLGVSGIWYTSRLNRDRDISINNQRQTVLQEYINKMSDLLLEKNLGESTKKTKVRTIAQAHTMTTLSDLDSQRKQKVIQFLYDSGLIKGHDPIIVMVDAYLKEIDLTRAYLPRINLRGAYMRRVDFSFANLSGADMSEATLSEADLSLTNLSKANLKEINLSEANLNFANMSKADLTRAYLARANLSGTDLRGTNFSGADLKDTNLKDIIYDHTTMWPENFTPPLGIA